MTKNMRKTKRVIPAPKPGKYVYEYIMHVNALGQIDKFIGKNKYLLMRDDGENVVIGKKGSSKMYIIERTKVFKISKTTFARPYTDFLVNECELSLSAKKTYLDIQQGKAENIGSNAVIYEQRYCAPCDKVLVYSYQNAGKKDIDALLIKEFDEQKIWKERIHMLELEERNISSHIDEKVKKIVQLNKEVNEETEQLMKEINKLNYQKRHIRMDKRIFSDILEDTKKEKSQ